MKRLFLSVLALAAVAVSGVALAGGNELAYFKIPELVTLAPSSIGSGDFVPVYDASAKKVKKVDATAVLDLSVLTASDAVASGQTSKATTLTGVTASSICVASLAEVATNAVYIRAVVPTTNTVTTTISADPGASNQDLKIICVN